MFGGSFWFNQSQRYEQSDSEDEQVDSSLRPKSKSNNANDDENDNDNGNNNLSSSSSSFAPNSKHQKLMNALDMERDQMNENNQNDNDNESNTNENDTHAAPLFSLGGFLSSSLSSSSSSSSLPPHLLLTLCVECGDQTADVKCVECDDRMCSVCFAAVHAKGNRRKHNGLKIESEKNDNNTNINVTMSTSNENKEEKEKSSESEIESDRINMMSDHSNSVSPLSPNAQREGEEQNHKNNKNKNKKNNNDDNDDDDDDDDNESTFSSSSSPTIPPPLSLSSLSISLAEYSPHWFIERSRYSPMRLTLEERKVLRLLESALNVSEYTDKIDIITSKDKVKRIQEQLRDICSILSGLVVASDYKLGQILIKDREFSDNEEFFQNVFEIGRRHKIRNPEKMRNDYGKLMFILQDSQQPQISDLMGFTLVKNIKTVFSVLESAGAISLLMDKRMKIATGEIKSHGKQRWVIDAEIKEKNNTIKSLSKEYSNEKITAEEISAAIYSMGDAQTFIVQNRNPCEDMIQWLKKGFHPHRVNGIYTLSIMGGTDGARLSHSHTAQFYYVYQSLALWSCILYEMYKLWMLSELDLLDEESPYKLRNTGQGLQRVQNCPRVGKIMHNILYNCQSKMKEMEGERMKKEREEKKRKEEEERRKKEYEERKNRMFSSSSMSFNSSSESSSSDSSSSSPSSSSNPPSSSFTNTEDLDVSSIPWIGSSVIHLGDSNVPSALNFLDKYNQVSRILNPILLVLKNIDGMMGKEDTRMYINNTFGSADECKLFILTDFFRHAFDGSGANDFFSAGSCIDGRLTSAWNWCSMIEKKPYYNVFLLAGFTSFDGQQF